MWGKETPPVNQHLRTISWSAPLQQEALWIGSCCLSCVPCVCSFVVHGGFRDPLPLHAFSTPSSCQYLMSPPCVVVHGSSLSVIKALRTGRR